MSWWKCFEFFCTGLNERDVKFNPDTLYSTTASIVKLNSSDLDIETTYSSINFDSTGSEIVSIKTSGPSTVLVSKIGKIIIVAPYNMDMHLFTHTRDLDVSSVEDTNAEYMKMSNFTQDV
jgi:hypothetical protein